MRASVDIWSLKNSGIVIPVNLQGYMRHGLAREVHDRWPGLADRYRKDGAAGTLSRCYWGSKNLECNCGKSAQYGLHHSWCDSRGLPPNATCLHFYVPQIAVIPALPADSEYYKLVMFPVSRCVSDDPDPDMIRLSTVKLINLMKVVTWTVAVPASVADESLLDERRCVIVEGL